MFPSLQKTRLNSFSPCISLLRLLVATLPYLQKRPPKHTNCAFHIPYQNKNRARFLVNQATVSSISDSLMKPGHVLHAIAGAADLHQSLGPSSIFSSDNRESMDHRFATAHANLGKLCDALILALFQPSFRFLVGRYPNPLNMSHALLPTTRSGEVTRAFQLETLQFSTWMPPALFQDPRSLLAFRSPAARGSAPCL